MKTLNQTHTPTPWKIVTIGDEHTIYAENTAQTQILPRFWANERVKLDAAFIVRAVNSHEELLEILTVLKDCFSDNEGERENFEATISKETLTRVEQAIAKAESKGV